MPSFDIEWASSSPPRPWAVSRPICLSVNNLIRSFSYQKLPQSPLRLSIRKLDGSCFDVEVERTAKVAEIKEAVEQFFNESPREDEENVDISWSHVWSNFCLCYEEDLLLDDKASIRYLGIKDGDQLHFVRQLSPNSTLKLEKRRMKSRRRAFDEQLVV